MAYGKSRAVTKKSRRKKPRTRKARKQNGVSGFVGSIAKKAFSMATKALSHIDLSCQIKAWDLAAEPILVNNPVPKFLSGISQGTGDNTRVGDSIRLVSLTIRGNVRQVASPAINSSAITLIFFTYSDSRGALPSLDDIFHSWTSYNNSANATNAPYNPDNAGNFNVVRRFDFVLCETGDTMKFFSDYIEWKPPLTLTFEGDGDQITDANKNHLYYIAITNSNDTDCVMNLGLSLRFVA